jgi:hypothetical protein
MGDKVKYEGVSMGFWLSGIFVFFVSMVVDNPIEAFRVALWGLLVFGWLAYILVRI